MVVPLWFRLGVRYMVFQFVFRGSVDSDSAEVAETLIEQALDAVPGVKVDYDATYVGEPETGSVVTK